jgi:HAD superfamily hydrolase (TIGR01509 family)
MLNTILWDHDGVLVDTERLYFEATRAALARVGVDLTVEQYRQHLLVESRGAWHLAEQRGASQAEVERLRDARNALYLRLLSENDVMVPGALELLQRLRPRHRMAVVTSSRRDHFDAIHHGSGLNDLVEFVLAREDYGQSKPHPEPYLAAVERLGAAKADCLVVEDSLRGLAAARAAGLTCWIIHSEMTAGLAFDAAERQFESLAEVGEALMAMAG